MNCEGKFTITDIEQFQNPDAPGLIIRAAALWGDVAAVCGMQAAPGFDPLKMHEALSRGFYVHFLGHAGHA